MPAKQQEWTDEQRAAQRERSKAYFAEQKEKGLCAFCHQPLPVKEETQEPEATETPAEPTEDSTAPVARPKRAARKTTAA